MQPPNQTVSQQVPTGRWVMKVAIPYALKIRLLQIQLAREMAAGNRCTFQDLVIEAIENTYPEETKRKRTA